MPEFDGKPIRLCGQDYVLPPLSFKGFKASRAQMKAVSEAQTQDPEVMQNAFVDVIHQALLRNYPGMSRDVVEDGIDWATGPALFADLMALSMPQAAAGETRVESPSGASTGT